MGIIILNKTQRPISTNFVILPFSGQQKTIQILQKNVYRALLGTKLLLRPHTVLTAAVADA